MHPGTTELGFQGPGLLIVPKNKVILALVPRSSASLTYKASDMAGTRQSYSFEKFNGSLKTLELKQEFTEHIIYNSEALEYKAVILTFLSFLNHPKSL